MMKSPLSPRVTLIAAAVLLVACGGGQRDKGDAASGKDDAPLASRECSREQGDSAQAVCGALNIAERTKATRAKLDTFERRGDTLCVVTTPADDIPRIDGNVGVVTVGGYVKRIMGDSISCGWE